MELRSGADAYFKERATVEQALPFGPHQRAFDFSKPAPPPAVAPPPPSARFNGPEYEPARDQGRLTGQLLRIWAVMKDQQWRTLPQIAAATGDPEASISAQLRHLRKARFGGHAVNRQHIANGLFEYQLVPKAEAPKLDHGA